MEPKGQPSTDPAQNHPRALQVLIVDHDELQMRSLCSLLRTQGYETIGFTEAVSTLSALRQSQFDLLFADLTIPEINGMSLLRSAHQIDPELISIVIATQPTLKTAFEALQSGAFDFILKPFDLTAILPVLSRAFCIR